MATSGSASLSQYRAQLARLNDAYAAGHEHGFELALKELFASSASIVMTDVHRLSDSLLAALTRFRSESRIATLTVKDVPEAQLRLDHVLKMTEEAAHRTLDIIEVSVPLADATAKHATELSATLDSSSAQEIRLSLSSVRSNAEQLRRNLTEVMLAQGFQDLTGQILRGVRTLVGEVESVLQELAAVAGVSLTLAEPETGDATAPQGPAIPDITRNAVTHQDDVDDLIAGLGI
jgi:chemotaxis protein CheZ